MEKQYEDAGIYTPSTNALTLEEMGSFPRLVLEHPCRVRGNNELNSFAAVGTDASMLVQGQANEDVYAPLRQHYDMDGHVLLMGVDLCSATAIHYAEQLAGSPVSAGRKMQQAKRCRFAPAAAPKDLKSWCRFWYPDPGRPCYHPLQ